MKSTAEIFDTMIAVALTEIDAAHLAATSFDRTGERLFAKSAITHAAVAQAAIAMAQLAMAKDAKDMAFSTIRKMS